MLEVGRLAMGFRFVVVTVLFGILSARPAESQTVGEPKRPRPEVFFMLGISRPTVVVLVGGGLRSAPTASENGERFDLGTQDLGVRAYLRPDWSVAASIGRSTDGSWSETLSKPPRGPVFTNYATSRAVMYESAHFAVSTAVDFRVSTRLVPFLEAGAEFRSVTRRQVMNYAEYDDPNATSVGIEENAGRQVGVFGGAGVRMSIGSHASVLVEGLGFPLELESVVDMGVLAAEPVTRLGRVGGRVRAGLALRF